MSKGWFKEQRRWVIDLKMACMIYVSKAFDPTVGLVNYGSHQCSGLCKSCYSHLVDEYDWNNVASFLLLAWFDLYDYTVILLTLVFQHLISVPCLQHGFIFDSDLFERYVT